MAVDSSTTGICGDTPLAIAATAAGFYTTLVAILVTIYGYIMLARKARSEVEALEQELLTLRVEWSILEGDPKKLIDLPPTIATYAIMALIRGNGTFTEGKKLLDDANYRPSGLNGPRTEKDCHPQYALLKNLKWIWSSSDKAKDSLAEAARSRSLLSACERILILHRLDRSLEQGAHQEHNDQNDHGSANVPRSDDPHAPHGQFDAATRQRHELPRAEGEREKALKLWFQGNSVPNKREASGRSTAAQGNVLPLDRFDDGQVAHKSA